ncbi:hypothetical protein, partial [Roseiarcus sp.]|uniref:hypothetical protein n=1 Tax=Roseiarcus sp. TaxID=1969460 RepID=UPI003F998D51
GLGYLAKNPQGGYVNTQAGEAGHTAAAQAAREADHATAAQAAPTETHTPLDDDGSAAVFKHGVSPSLTARAVEEIATAGAMSPDVREASQQLNADPSIVSSVMQKAMAAYGQQFERHAAKAGVASGDFTAWAQQQRGDALKMAMVRHVTQQDPRAYNALLAEFKQASRR